ncbi:MAG: hypothetical protein P4L40_26705 [Terracidiphilus sp.]|nr:hypothetical protein [Terracidiphilus sp.]
MGLSGRIPVLSAVGSYANEMVARRADGRSIADAIVKRVNALSGSAPSRSAPAPSRGTAGAPARSGAPPPGYSYGGAAPAGAFDGFVTCLCVCVTARLLLVVVFS